VVSFAWLFFRASDLNNAWDVLLGVNISKAPKIIETPIELILAFALFVLLEVVFRKEKINQLLDRTPFVIRWSGYAVVLFFILSFSGTTNHPFIYFQF